MSEDNVDDEDVAEVIETFHTGERYVGEPTGQVLHERGIPLALRVRSGFFEENGLNLEGAGVEWADIEYISLGIIRHSLGSLEPPKGMMRQVVGQIMGKGKGDRADSKAPRYQESIFLDIYSSQHDAPFRFEAANINYRAFLGKEALYISQHNFYRLMVRIARKSDKASLNDNAYFYLLRNRDQVRHHGAIYDYELECQTDLGRLELLHKTTEVDLSRDSYTTEDESGEFD